MTEICVNTLPPHLRLLTPPSGRGTARIDLSGRRRPHARTGQRVGDGHDGAWDGQEERRAHQPRGLDAPRRCGPWLGLFSLTKTKPIQPKNHAGRKDEPRKQPGSGLVASQNFPKKKLNRNVLNLEYFLDLRLVDYLQYRFNSVHLESNGSNGFPIELLSTSLIEGSNLSLTYQIGPSISLQTSYFDAISPLI